MAEAEPARWHSRLGGQVILLFGFAALATKAARTRSDPAVSVPSAKLTSPRSMRIERNTSWRG